MPDNERMIGECLEVREQFSFTPWEEEFLESVKTQVEEGRTLSEKQEDVLRRIYEKVCGSPY